MIQLLFLFCCAAVLAFAYRRFSCLAKEATKDGVNSRGMLHITSTNNSYDPMGDVLASLDGDLAKLDLELHTDMKGYMDGNREKG